MIDLGQHAAVLRELVPPADAALIHYAMMRMEFGRRKYERPGIVHTGRDFIAEGLEELVDGLNRLVMELARRERVIQDCRNLKKAAEEILAAIKFLKRECVAYPTAVRTGDGRPATADG